MNLAIGSDHAGFELKTYLMGKLEDHQLKDYGTYSSERADYPDFAHLVAEAVEKGEHDFGILICGSANGICMTANKHQNIRAAICWNAEITALARQHNNANIICLPARFISNEEALEFVNVFLTTAFEGGRHENRVDKIGCS